MNTDEFMEFIKEEFPGVLDTHWNWDLLDNILTYATSEYEGEELIQFLMNIIPEVTHEEYQNFM